MAAVGLTLTARERTQRLGGQVATSFAGRRRSWDTFWDRVARTAAGLRALGVKEGDRVGVLAANSDRHLDLYFAIPWAGAVMVAFNTRWSLEENRVATKDCEPKVLFVDSELMEIAAALKRDLPSMQIVAMEGTPQTTGFLADEEVIASPPIPDVGRSASDLWAIFYTGGTTGRPKGVMLSHGAVTSNSELSRQAGLIPDGSRVLHVAPMFHMADGLTIIAGVLAGGSHVILRAFEASALLRAIGTERATTMLLVPTMIQQILDHPDFPSTDLSSWESLIYGASPISEALLTRATSQLPNVNFYQLYGMSELGPIATVLPPECHRGAFRDAGKHKAAGRALPGIDLKIVDPTGSAVPLGQTGEIVVRSPSVMLGYWRRPEETAEVLREGWMHTGDGGRLDADGFVYVLDRIKDMIVTGGENVYSLEVEGALATHPDVMQCAVIGVPDELWGERVHAVVVARPGRSLPAESLIAHCRGLIASYKCPRSLEVRDSLPLSAAGKILKRELRRAFWEGRDRQVG